METRAKVHITRTKIEGPKLDKNNKQYYKVGIQTRENGQQWYNSNYFPFNPDRWEGSEQDVILFDEEYQGKTYQKFKLPPREGGRPGAGGGMSEADRSLMQKIMDYAYAANTNIMLLRNELKDAGVLKAKEVVPSHVGPIPFEDVDPFGPSPDDIDPRDIIPD